MAVQVSGEVLPSVPIPSERIALQATPPTSIPDSVPDLQQGGNVDVPLHCSPGDSTCNGKEVVSLNNPTFSNEVICNDVAIVAETLKILDIGPSYSQTYEVPH